MGRESTDESDDGPIDLGGLRSPERIGALTRMGLTAKADEELDGVAERVRRWLGVPVALVSLVEPERQVFPGLSGLIDPWASIRFAPLSHSFCKHLVVRATPLVVEDARVDPLTADNAAIVDMGVVAYAGMPLTDQAGVVLGSLCAIDTRPRPWTSVDLEVLRDLAWGCSMALRLRLAEHDAAEERARRDELEAVQVRSFERSQLLLEASQAFTDTVSVADIHQRVSELAIGGLTPDYVGMVLVDPDGRIHRLAEPAGSSGLEDLYGGNGMRWQDSSSAVATVIREQRIRVFADEADGAPGHRQAVDALLRTLGLRAAVLAPMFDSTSPSPSGVLVLGWEQPHDADPPELLSITAIAGYAAQALERARRLQSRIGVVHELQQAMLTDLPVVAGLSWAARYRPADARENVGGDWYDAIALPSRPSPGVLVSVGDIVGHDVGASAIMGQARSMLRQVAWDRRDAPPSALVSAFDAAADGVGLAAAGTMVLARLSPGRAGWRGQWTNAGHPPPVLLFPDGTTSLLEVHDAMFGFPSLRELPRHDHDVELEPGTTLILYSDGLIERPGRDIDDGIADLRAHLTALVELAPRDLVDALVDQLDGATTDDVVAFVIRVDHPSGAPS